MSEHRSRNWLKISCIGCVGAPCLMLMLTFGFVKCQIGKIGNTLEPELAKLQKMGIATEPDQLNPSPSVPDEDNAALIYRQISAEMKRLGTKDRQDKKYLENYAGSPTDTPYYVAALKRYDSVYKLIDQLKERKRVDFKRDYKQGFNLLFPEYAEIKGVAKMLMARTRYHVGRGELDAALNDIDTQLAIVGHLSEEPMLIGSLVAIAISSIAYVNIDFYLQAIKDNQPMLAKTEAVLARHQKLPSLRQALIGEMVLGRTAIQSIKSWKDLEMSMGMQDESSGLERSLDRLTMNDPAFRKMFEAKQVQLWREFFEAAPKDPSDYRGYDKAMEALDQKIQADDSLENKLNQMLFPVFSQAGQAMVRCQGQQQTALLAVKLLRMRPTGLPKDLKRFGNLAIDPVTNKPMGYVRKGKGFKVWNAGHDGVDNGGVPYVMGSGQDRTGTDQVFGFDIGLPKPIIKSVNAPSSGFGGVGGPGFAPGSTELR
jgi:hypothetical protein